MANGATVPGGYNVRFTFTPDTKSEDMNMNMPYIHFDVTSDKIVI